MGLRIKSVGLGTIEINPTDTASNVTVVIPATTGRLTYTDSTTGGMYLPVGTTAQRPASPATGMMRYNTTTGLVETYNGTSWG
jgi:hypothetical protein